MITGNIGAVDPDGDRLTYKLIAGPQYGTVVIDPLTGNFTYTPTSYFAQRGGAVGFTVRVSDHRPHLLSFLFSPDRGSPTARIAVNVEPLSDPASSPPLEAFEVEKVIEFDLPDGVKVTGADLSPDGEHLILEVEVADGSTQIAVTNLDGADYQCISCGLVPKRHQSQGALRQPENLVRKHQRAAIRRRSARGSRSHHLHGAGVRGIDPRLSEPHRQEGEVPIRSRPVGAAARAESRGQARPVRRVRDVDREHDFQRPADEHRQAGRHRRRIQTRRATDLQSAVVRGHRLRHGLRQRHAILRGGKLARGRAISEVPDHHHRPELRHLPAGHRHR
ncbi:hypothetical protein HZU38_06655 [Mycolicibacterium vanbaalenii]|nr:hypothetical protein K5L12_29090 [Mycolicibacterium austroafricanum]UJL30151.1 hypothetical protein HZU38_06655 [Mycolicibacterium vanbaalenii]